MMPVVVGEVENGAESDIGFIRPVFIDSIVDATSVYWEEDTVSIDGVLLEAGGERPFNQAQR